jgi:hypothetical protein
MGSKPSLSVGDLVNHFLVLDLLPSEGSGKHRKYKVECPRCRCEAVMLKQNIVKSNSCGCLKKDSSTWKRAGAINRPWTLPEGEASFRALYSTYKRSANKREIEFLLTKDQFKELIVQPCFYCGSAGQSQKMGCKRSNGSFSYTGIDRFDNRVGYTEKNSVPCCKTCNFMKLDHDFEAFMKHLQKIINHLK